MFFALDSSPQVLTKAGVLNVPEWYEAGKVSAEQTGIALGEYAFKFFCVQQLQQTDSKQFSQAVQQLQCFMLGAPQRQ